LRIERPHLRTGLVTGGVTLQARCGGAL
jgi:hypothetical protein